jgi:hypothetical protein
MGASAERRIGKGISLSIVDTPVRHFPENVRQPRNARKGSIEDRFQTQVASERKQPLRAVAPGKDFSADAKAFDEDNSDC